MLLFVKRTAVFFLYMIFQLAEQGVRVCQKKTTCTQFYRGWKASSFCCQSKYFASVLWGATDCWAMSKFTVGRSADTHSGRVSEASNYSFLMCLFSLAGFVAPQSKEFHLHQITIDQVSHPETSPFLFCIVHTRSHTNICHLLIPLLGTQQTKNRLAKTTEFSWTLI